MIGIVFKTWFIISLCRLYVPLGSDPKITLILSVMNSKTQHFKIDWVFVSVDFFTTSQFDMERLLNTVTF